MCATSIGTAPRQRATRAMSTNAAAVAPAACANKRTKTHGASHPSFASPPARKSLTFAKASDAFDDADLNLNNDENDATAGAVAAQAAQAAFDTPYLKSSSSEDDVRVVSLKRKEREEATTSTTTRGLEAALAACVESTPRTNAAVRDARAYDGHTNVNVYDVVLRPGATSPEPTKRSSSPPAPPRKLGLGVGMSFGYTPSRGDTRYDASERVDLDEPATPALAGPCAMIPSALDAVLGLPLVDGATLRSMLVEAAAARSRHATPASAGSGVAFTVPSTSSAASTPPLAHGTPPNVVLIDCRFPYQYAAGRIASALNMYQPLDVQRFLTTQLGINAGATTVLVFYCEHGIDNSSRMWRHVRNLDRRDHIADYPALSFPHMYVLRRGFDAFFDEHRDCCEGVKITADDFNYAHSRREYAAKSRECWFHASAATSMTRVNSFHDVPSSASRARFDPDRDMDDD
jgi:hypothetical protein